MSLTSFSRPLVSTFYFLIFSLLTLFTFTPLHAESTAYFRETDTPERSAERLHDLLQDLGYTVECDLENQPRVAVHQQGHHIVLVIKSAQDQLTMVVAQVKYKFNPRAASPEQRALVANRLNDAEFGIKACVCEDDDSFYFEYVLQFDSYLRPRMIKTFLDQAVARSYRSVFENASFKRTFYGDNTSPDDATNADEVEASDDSDDATMTDEDAKSSTTAPSDEAPATKPSTKPEAEPETKPSTTEKPAAKPAAPSKKSDDEDDAEEEEDSATTPPAPSNSSSAKGATPADEARDTSSEAATPAGNTGDTSARKGATPTLSPAVPPTTPAAPARTKRARA